VISDSGGDLRCYLRAGDEVFETYEMKLLDLTPYGRQESWEDSPAGWPQDNAGAGSWWRRDGRPVAQWTRTKEPVIEASCE
jgi:predicted dithiol-disulfide oxidoreductase (DUF899 family)